MDGRYSDFSYGWFIHLGPLLINPFFINFIYPFIQPTVGFLIKEAKDLWDRRFTSNDQHMTSTSSLIDYADIKSLDRFEIESAYPKIMSTIMICMTYGFGFPIMFPLTAVFLIIIYFVHKYIIVSFRRPPMYDDTLNKIFIYYIKYGALFYTFFSYWMLTNRQMFWNETSTKNYKDEQESANHFLLQWPSNYCFLLVFLLGLILAYIFMFEVVYDCFSVFWMRSAKVENMTIEKLPSFYKALDKKNLNLWIEEEEMVRKEFGYKKLYDETFRELKEERRLRREEAYYSIENS